MTNEYNNCRVIVTYDDYAENPTDYGGFDVVSFNRRHIAYKHPDEVGLTDPMCIGLRRKLATGTAFLLSYYEHGACRWSLAGSGPSCPWDSVDVAGVLYLDRDVWQGKTYAEREDYARQVLRTYTDWCNGWVHALTLVDGDGEEIESFRGVFNSDVEDTCAGEFPGAEIVWP